MTIAAQSSGRPSLVVRIYNQPYLLLVLMAVFWAANIVVARYVVGRVPPFSLTFIRWSGTFLIFAPFAWPHLQRDWAVIRKHVPLLLLMAFTGFAGNNGFAYWGLQHTQALNGLLIQSSGPLFVALWMLILFGVRLTPTQAIGIAMSLFGVLVIILHGRFTSLAKIEFNIGDVGVVMGLVVLGVYAALIPRRPPIHALSFMTFVTGTAAVMTIPLVILEIAAGNVMKFDAITVATGIFMVIFPSAMGYLFYNRGIELIGPNRAAPFIHLVPLFGSVMAISLLGEELHLFHLIGYALVLSGVITASRKPRVEVHLPSGATSSSDTCSTSRT
ncbi:MAG: DMT family transporter [Bradyrhizobiaceae bacterium]|nr:MAG: DMT family transporter [Bradyrhizobiaceae bacterium]